MTDFMNLFNELDAGDFSGIREDYVRAPFGYAGGKSKCLDKILPHLPYRDAYIEPFGGSGAVLLARQPSKLEVFNDRYAGVVAFYRCLHDKDLVDKLIERLSFLIYAREEFIWCKDTWKNCGDNVERAARWYYMHIFSFSNKGRHFGRSIKSKHTGVSKIENHIKDFHIIHNRIKNVLIENQDWRQILKDFDSPNVVFYMDPPYLEVSGGVYTHSMLNNEHKEMLDRIFTLDGFVAVSGYANDLYDSYAWNNRYVWEQLVTIKGLAFTEENRKLNLDDSNKRQTSEEVLWIKE